MIIVHKDGVEAARLSNDLELQTSRDSDFTILWDEVVEEGIFVNAPPPLQKGEEQELGDVQVSVKPSADTFFTVERYLFNQGYEMERK